MACTRPIRAWRDKIGRNKDTKLWPITFNPKNGYTDMPVTLPCGRCISCRLERSRQWAVRCINEAQLHRDNCFITLTYSDEYIPENNNLDKPEIIKFMKRLRGKYKPRKIRYYLCGEYGEKLSRPHYHICLFGHTFPGMELHDVSEAGFNIYSSKKLKKLWPWGFNSIGDLNWETAAYTARYVTKKITGEMAETHYNGKEPEFASMSRNPGLGHDWYIKYETDITNTDQVIVRDDLGIRPPIYYDNIAKKINPNDLDKRKKERRRKAINELDMDDLFKLDNIRQINFKQKNKRGIEK